MLVAWICFKDLIANCSKGWRATEVLGGREGSSLPVEGCKDSPVGLEFALSKFCA